MLTVFLKKLDDVSQYLAILCVCGSLFYPNAAVRRLNLSDSEVPHLWLFSYIMVPSPVSLSTATMFSLPKWPLGLHHWWQFRAIAVYFSFSPTSIRCISSSSITLLERANQIDPNVLNTKLYQEFTPNVDREIYQIRATSYPLLRHFSQTCCRMFVPFVAIKILE